MPGWPDRVVGKSLTIGVRNTGGNIAPNYEPKGSASKHPPDRET